MPGATNAGSIRAVLSGPTVLRTFGFALVGRLAYGLLPLCLLFTIREATGSFAVAATASAALGFATLAMPLQARLVDRFGQGRVLPCYSSCFVVLLLTAATLSKGAQPDGLWVGCGLLLGLSAPALGPAMRAQWREIAPEGPARRVAYSIDSVAEESLYLLGPLGASVVLITGPARVGLVVAAAFITIGTLALIGSPHVPTVGACASSRPGVADHALARRGFRGLLFLMLLFGAAGSACFVGVAALADSARRPGAVGVIEAAMAAGAVLAGLAWTRLGREPTWSAALSLLLLVSAVAQAATIAVAPHLALVGAFLVVSGAVAAPAIVVAFTAADTLVDPDQRTEASTWVSTALNGGSAAGTAMAALVLSLGNAAPFVLATSLSVVALGAVLMTRRRSLEAAGD